MGGMLPTVGTGGRHRPRPGVQAGIACKERAGQAGRREGKRAGSFQARHSQRIQPRRNPGQKKRVPSPVSPSLQCHTAAAQAPRHHRGSAPSDLFSPITRALFPSPGPRLIDWNLLKTN